MLMCLQLLHSALSSPVNNTHTPSWAINVIAARSNEEGGGGLDLTAREQCAIFDFAGLVSLSL